MSSLKVYDESGAASGEFEIADELLESRRGGQAVHDVVVAYRNSMRAGTASTKQKGEVSGSGAKPWRQKGTGRARAGYKQSPVWRGGGTAFGPKPRDYGVKVNKKVGRLAFQRVLSEKIAGDSVRIVDSIGISEPKTKQVVAFIEKQKIEGSVMLVTAERDANLELASRNIPHVDVVEAAGLNTYDVLYYETLVVTKAAAEKLTARLAGRTGGEA